jgi:hypothetical protein
MATLDVIAAITTLAVLSTAFVDAETARAADARATIESMQWVRRVVLISAADSADPEYVKQRQALRSWAGAPERDVSVVEIIGDRVDGASEAASKLRQRFNIPAGRFSIVLIGKDGHVALQSATPLSTDVLSETIDAMPMRRAGQR